MVNNLDDLVFISTNKDGNFYFGFKIVAPRSINAKAKRSADELLIVGVPKSKIQSYLKSLVED